MNKLFRMYKALKFHCVRKILRIMKLTGVLMLISLLQVSAIGLSQRVSLEMENVSIEEFIVAIENQTDYRFVYLNETIQDKLITVKVKNTTVPKLLDIYFSEAGINYRIINNDLVVLTSKESSEITSRLQQYVVRGTVTDENGDPVPGTNVTIKGTNIGTVTDPEGLFSIEVADPATAVLVFSFVGYQTQEVVIGNQTEINVTLELGILGMDEVVMVGYGTRLREALTGSVSTMSGEDMGISTTSSALGRIQGQVSGVTITSANTPGGFATIRVRGLGTINDNQPLYIIDGVPADPGNELNPNDIESISVLKDASSAAIYGTRGANGVIIITTKSGRANQKHTTFNARVGITSAVNQYDMLGVSEFGEMLWLEARNRGYTPGVDWSHLQYGDGTEPRIPDYILPAGAMSGDPGVNPDLYSYPDYMIIEANKKGTDWFDEIYRNGIIQEYDLSLTGGGDKVTYAFSGGYLNEEGSMIHTGFERFSFRNNITAKLNNWFSVGQSLKAFYTNRHGDLTDNYDEAPISRAFQSQAIIPVYDIMGNFAGSRGLGMGGSQNPVAMLTRAKNNYSKNFRLLGNVYGEANIIEGLSFKSFLGYDYRQENFKNMRLANPEAAMAEMIDRLTQGTNYSFQWNWANTLEYDIMLAEVHSVHVILGTEAIANSYSFMDAGRSQYFSTDPNYMQLSSGEINQINSGSGSEWSIFSIFGRANYDLLGRYFLEVTIRRDGSSRFGPENRYATFPSASFAWAISQENFMAGTRNWLDFLKLRLGWGRSGNDRIGNYNVYSTYSTHNSRAAYALDGSNTATSVGFQPSTMGNPDVTWETTETFNLGLDFTVLNNSLALSIDGWQRNTSDMLYRLSVPQVMGMATPPYVNIGEMKNTGFDLELGYNNTAFGGKFRYGVTATISRYVNEITKLSNDVEEEIIMGGFRSFNYTRASVGTSFPEFYGYKVDGIFQTQEEADAHPAFGTYNQPGHFKYRDLNKDGVINSEDMTYIGSPHPDFIGGLNIDLGYGNFDLNMFFYGSYGNEMINLVRRWTEFGLLGCNLDKDALYETWGSPYLDSNEDATLPIFDLSDGSQQPSTHFVEDGSFLRLKALQLSYSLPRTVYSRIGMNNIKIYFKVTNLFTLTKYSGLDPELHETPGRMGLDQGAWPTPRQFIFGLTLGL